MAHPNADMFMNDFAALAAGELAPLFDRTADDIVMVNDEGAGPWRELHGKEQVLDFWTRWTELFDGTFRQDVTDVFGEDDRVVLFIHEHGTARGHRFDNRAIYLVRIRDGRYIDFRTMDTDREAVAAFWAAVGMPALT
jgi:ketosteroid isomerase-like protein